MEVSVIIPVYNAAPFVEKAVNSALQLDEVKEVLLIEDGSPDNSLEICQKLAKEDLRVRLFQHPDKGNHGASASRNLGLISAKFPFIAFLDADDFFLPKRFETDKKVFSENPDADGVYNAIGAHFYSEKGHQLFVKHFSSTLTTIKKEVSPNQVFSGLIGLQGDFGYFSLNGLTLKKESLQKMNGLLNEKLKFHEDTDFIFRLAYYLRLYPGSINEPIALRGVHDENRITKHKKKERKARVNQLMFWHSVYIWSLFGLKEPEIREYLKRRFFQAKVLSSSILKGWFKFVYFSFCDINILKKAHYYDNIHYFLFGRNRLSTIMLKIKYKIQNFTGVSWKGF